MVAVPVAAQDQTGNQTGNQTGDRAVVVYLGLQDDPWYDPQPVYTGLSLRDRSRPVDGARTALRSARVLARALGIAVALDERLLAPGASAVQAVRDARAEGALAILLDLPAQDMAEIVAAEGDAGGLLINIRHGDARWRAEDCAPDLIHTLPSDAMLADALAQYLRLRGWDRVLLLAGTDAADAGPADAARRAAKKFGLRLVADRAFALTNDPRRRDEANIALLTGDATHDVVWLIDSVGEFGRYVPYSTYAARPVVGTEGLSARAWHWTWERHGAPQLNQRFRREADRDMTGADWAAWAGMQAVIAALQRTGSTDPAAIRDFVLSDALSLDLYKGAPGSFRAWNGQLRQPLLLATHNAVIARAPLEGFEHRSDTLDTLGFDAPESGCAR
jgi:ABC transporter substrate binding protein (PQQ-dependent alcohol dehydrogenase system)